MTHGRRFTSTLVLGFTIGIVVLSPLAASASEDGWAHRSTATTSADGWSVRTQPASVTDGWAHRSSDAPRVASVKDGFQVATIELPQPAQIRDGFQVASTQLPQTATVRDGWEVATMELPRSTGAQAVSAPSRPVITTADLVGLALAAATLAAILTAMSITVYRHRHHAI